MDASEEADMTFEDEQSSELTIEADAAEVEPQAVADVEDDDVVEAHTWRAQS